MRYTWIAVVAVALALAGYCVWPFYDLYRTVRAIENHDIAPIIRRVDFGAVRGSLARQLEATYWRMKGQEPPKGGVAAMVSASMADPILARVITPEALSDLLRQGWPETAAPGRPPGFVGLSWPTLGTAWQLFANSEYGIGRFDILLPASVERRYQFGLQYRLEAWRWRLTGLELPEPVRVRLVEELIKMIERK